jgi:hypothetical protein
MNPQAPAAADAPEGAPRYRGVNYEKGKRLFRSRLYCKGQHTTLGRYRTAELAAQAHDYAAAMVLGNRACTNFGLAATQNVTWVPRFGRTIQLKLVELRNALLLEASTAPDEQQARSMRMAAAAAAFRGSSSEHHRQPTTTEPRCLQAAGGLTGRCEDLGRDGFGTEQEGQRGAGLPIAASEGVWRLRPQGSGGSCSGDLDCAVAPAGSTACRKQYVIASAKLLVLAAVRSGVVSESMGQ